ncbi:unnamed protein product [Bursaphelenchus xylophilus]|uniref:(pine wood nematode) hypothetical protein n=1 Tax=Bursaphelenchus xylophilus TaxID=6326 RepID=A0A1I7RUU7_BURXY|nr:unnamed protein product [Bursaphelenchus xylophilus]CAG9105425.1 unnamed protein product [Bursaphelenchus xylophilus]
MKSLLVLTAVFALLSLGLADDDTEQRRTCGGKLSSRICEACSGCPCSLDPKRLRLLDDGDLPTKCCSVKCSNEEIRAVVCPDHPTCP